MKKGPGLDLLCDPGSQWSMPGGRLHAQKHTPSAPGMTWHIHLAAHVSLLGCMFGGSFKVDLSFSGSRKHTPLLGWEAVAKTAAPQAP